ncbi:MAG: CusA/CzcA family heavy metal efflux RND transporter [Verrucomicrobiae bacterium]|nr:CusA/CzcA family heavy metal efflux RND transporter [Verrucomicrobiae bacterium]NNJ42678.1 efflux RND transporter permease subunit [Akkermansiaceae bacterium]
MFQYLIRFCLANRLLVFLFTALIVVAGMWAGSRVPVDAFPDTTPIQVQINTVAPSLNGEEIEQQITLPVELEISGLPGLASVRSVSKFGLSQVVATFDDDTDITTARQYISERLLTVELPDGVGTPQMGPISTGLGEIFHYVISSSDGSRSLEELRTIHDWIIKPELRKVPGVAEVNSWGGLEKQYHVVVDPELLLKFDLSLADLVEALEKNNRNVGGGRVTVSGQDLLVHGIGRVASIPEIERIEVASSEGTPIRVSDIAQVRIGSELRRGAVTANGQGEVVLGLAFMLMGENAQEVTKALKTRLEEIQPSIPKGVDVQVVYDRTELTDSVLGTVTHNLVGGAVLVTLTLLILLGNVRAGLLVAICIPLAMLFAVLGMNYFAITASLLSLGAIDFGLIVDGSVVMTEANLRGLAERTRRNGGRKLTITERFDCILESSRSVARPILFGMGIIAVVFLPILTLEGTEGKMFRPMAITFILALLGALIIAIVISPVLGHLFLPRKFKSEEGWFSRKLTGGYSAMLGLVMKARWVVLTVVLALLVTTGVIATKLGGEFIPRLSEGAVVANTIRLAGTSIDTSTDYNTAIEKLLKEKFPDEIRHVWSRIGTAEIATDPMGTELTDIFLSLKPREEWTQAETQDELVAKMQETVSTLPGVNILFTQPIEMRLNEMESGVRSDVGILIYGDSFEELTRLSDEIQQVLVDIEGQADVSSDQISGQPGLKIQLLPEKMARLGVSASEILPYIEAIGVLRVGEIYEGQRQFPLAIVLPDKYRTKIEAVRNLVIPTSTGIHVPLSEVADIVEAPGAATINREWGRRLIRVQTNVDGRDVVSFVEEAKRKIAEKIDLPEGYVIEWGGQFENLERARTRLSLVVPLTMILVFVLLYLSLRNFKDVGLIYLGIPFALVGGVLSLWLRDIPFSVSAAIGFIALFGIAVLNGQILIEAIRANLRDATDTVTAVKQAATQRLRPVLATAITDAIGFLPMAISTGVGSEVQKPLATVVIGGVITSTVLTLIVLPILYLMINRKCEKIEPETLIPTLTH